MADANTPKFAKKNRALIEDEDKKSRTPKDSPDCNRKEDSKKRTGSLSPTITRDEDGTTKKPLQKREKDFEGCSTPAKSQLSDPPNSSTTSTTSQAPISDGSNSVKRNSASKKLLATPEGQKSAVVLQSCIRRKIAQDEVERRIEWQQTRTHVLGEIVATEKNYVEGLRQVVDLFLEPLREELKMSDSPTIDQALFKDLFPQENIKILYTVGKQFFKSLEERMANWNTWTVVGDVFLELCDYLRIYAVYIEMYPLVDKTLAKLRKDKEFIKFLKKQCGSGDIQRFSSLLITPIQRIPRYQLLLQNLHSKTWKTHRDYVNLTKALDKMVATAQYVNDNAKAADSARKLVLIDESIIDKKSSLVSPNRTWIHDGSLLQFNKGEWKKRYFFLFNDLIVRTRKGKETYTFLEKVLLAKATVERNVSEPTKVAINDDEASTRCFEFSHPHPIKYILMCKDVQEKNQWCDLLEQMIDELNKTDEFQSEERMRIAKDRAHQARALITKQYHSLNKEDSNNLARAWVTRKSHTVDLSKSPDALTESSSDGSPTTPPLSPTLITTSTESGIRSYKKAMWSKMSPHDKLENVKQAEENLQHWEEEQKIKQEEKERIEREKQKELEEKKEHAKEVIVAKIDSLKKGELRSYRSAIEQYRKAKDAQSTSSMTESETDV